MRAGGEDGGYEQIRRVAGANGFAAVVRGRGEGAGGVVLALCAGEGTDADREQLPRRRDPADLQPQGKPLGAWCRMMAKDDARSGRQRPQRGQQACADPLVGHQPGVPVAHRPAIAATMTEHSHDALQDIEARIAQAARTAGRKPEDVTLIAVSKTHPADAILPLLEAGQRDFGENRVQEAQDKWPALRERFPDARLHLIGQLQSNKAADAVGIADAIHAVDRSSLVVALAKAMDASGRRPDCFVQVNIGDEDQKGGCAIADLPALLAEARAAGLPVAGLMCLPPAEVEPAPYFALLAKIARDEGVAGLSMGMSADFETAVTLGATHVRVGSALFGARA